MENGLRAENPVGGDGSVFSIQRRVGLRAKVGVHIFPYDVSGWRNLKHATVHPFVYECIAIG